MRAPLVAFVHETARELLEGGHTHLAERRSIVTAFCMIKGLDEENRGGVDGLPAIQVCARRVLRFRSNQLWLWPGCFGLGSPIVRALQACLEAAMECIQLAGGLLRQFMLDDKGVVCIWTFGLSSNVFEVQPLPAHASLPSHIPTPASRTAPYSFLPAPSCRTRPHVDCSRVWTCARSSAPSASTHASA
eukprot:878709-Prymnesium_polylepis.3